MKLHLSPQKFAQIIGGSVSQAEYSPNQSAIESICYDTRKIGAAEGAAFFALVSPHGNGHDFIEEAYNKGIRRFVISEKTDFILKDSVVFQVENTFDALFELAKYQRSLFKGTMIVVSGKFGKTTVKEWIYQLLSPEIMVSRSPKSYNSGLGIALSLLELKEISKVAIIEVKPHSELNPEFINTLISPNIGVWTTSVTQHPQAIPVDFIKQLFKGCSTFIHGEKSITSGLNGFKEVINCFPLRKELEVPSLLNDEVNRANIAVAYCVANQIVKEEEKLNNLLPRLTSLALRMETFDGVNNNVIINDAYSLDVETMRSALEFQQQIAKGKKRAVIIGLGDVQPEVEQEIRILVNEFSPETVVFMTSGLEEIPLISDTILLIKGTKKSGIQKLVNRFKINKHKTAIHIDLKALRKNILAHKQLLPKGTKIMAMVKAAGYGLGLQKMAQFIDSFGVEYLGVAYADEGIEIRNTGVEIPILVMNAEEESFESCILNRLEPAIYCFEQLDAFIAQCIYAGVENYPIHLKMDTGMHRLGFLASDVDRLLEIIDAQPEVFVKSVYSHLSDADNRRDKRFTDLQIMRFGEIIKKLSANLPYSFETHILNSSGIANFPKNSFSMARIGIGMYGISSNPELKRKLEPVLSWHSVISQVKTIDKGQAVGYNRAFIAAEPTQVATIPIGYADGFRRSLSNGKGYVIIQGRRCPTLGKVCMDMIMVDVSNLSVATGETVEIIGNQLSLEQMAELQETIPYEIMTSISSRVHRIYLE